jgi:pimeloyl-ACP methyl ester carboxylesterase
MDKKAILLVHGFASSSRSRKAGFFGPKFEAHPAVAFHAIDMNPTPPDFEYMTVTGQINRLRQYILDHELEPLRLIGSSLGGLVCLHYAHRFGGVERLLLLAPATVLHPREDALEDVTRWKTAGTVPVYHYGFERELPLRYDFELDGLHYRESVPAATRTLIVHGRDDTAVPIQHSRSYARRYGDLTRLIEVNAGHDLNPHLPSIWQQAEEFLLGNL